MVPSGGISTIDESCVQSGKESPVDRLDSQSPLPLSYSCSLPSMSGRGSPSPGTPYRLLYDSSSRLNLAQIRRQWDADQKARQNITQRQMVAPAQSVRFADEIDERYHAESGLLQE